MEINKRTKSKAGMYSLFLFALIGIFFIAVQFMMPHFLPAIFTSVARPFWRMEFAVGSGSLSSPQDLLAQNEMLKRELLAAQIRLQTVNSVYSENVEIKSLFGRDIHADDIFSQNIANASPISTTSASTTLLQTLPSVKATKVVAGHSNLILAPVLARPPFAPYDEMIIDGGYDLGFKVGDKVYASQNILIGTISDVMSQTSKVLLYSSPGQTYQVFVGSSSAPATAVGRGGGQYSLELPRSVVVNVGDIVDAPALSNSPFGIVGAIESEPTRAFETVIFAPPVNVYSLRWVLVEKSKNI